MGVRAQKKDITKFMGIPIDGTKAEMVEKIKAKGFTYNAKEDCLEGEFNGRDSYISVVTNRNKVYRIVVRDANYMNKNDIKIRFNRLVWQFLENNRYMPTDYKGEYFIDDDLNIEYETLVEKRRFEASFCQISDRPNDTLANFRDYVSGILSRSYSPESFSQLSNEEKELQYGLAARHWLHYHYNTYVDTLFGAERFMCHMDDTVGLYGYTTDLISALCPNNTFFELPNHTKTALYWVAVNNWLEHKVKMKSVWFMITELYGQYGIVLYYDNKYNESSGEDL